MGKKGAILSMIILGGGFLIGIFMMIVFNWIKTDEIKTQLLKEKINRVEPDQLLGTKKKVEE